MRRIVRTMIVTYPDICVPQWQGRKLRGFFAAGQSPSSLLHNHTETGGNLYRYPLIQYKIIDRHPTILALEEGIRELQPLALNSRELRLGDRLYSCGRMELALEDVVLGDAEEPCRYRFCTPWFALNQDNYHLYVHSSAEERKTLLKQVLTGNVLSMAKGLGVQVKNQLMVESNLREHPMRFKDETVLGFTGEFTVNYLLPDLFGLGKSVSRGFGAVQQIN